MPLKILQHKSFHVYNRENIEKVERDEAKARVLEEQEERRMIAADSEARLSLLRSKSRRKEKEKAKDEISFDEIAQHRRDGREGHEGNGHINFWEDLENGKVISQGNAEYQAEKAAEDRRTKDAFTMYLDKPAKEMKPWYSQVDMISSGDLEISERKKRFKEQVEEKALSLHDPMTTMNALLKRRKEVKAQRDREDSNPSPRSSSGYNAQYNPKETRRAHRHDPLRYDRGDRHRRQERHSTRSIKAEDGERHSHEDKSRTRRHHREHEHSHKDEDYKRKHNHRHRSKHD